MVSSTFKRLDLFIAKIMHYNFLSLIVSFSIPKIWLQIFIEWSTSANSDISRFWLIYLTTYPKIWLYLWTFPKENKNVLNIIRELVIGKGDLKERDAARFVRDQESQLKQLLREIERQNPTMIPALVNPEPLLAKDVTRQQFSSFFQ